MSATYDLPRRLREGFARDMGTSAGKRRLGVVPVRPAQFAPHLPADPQQQHAAGEQQADDRQQLDGDAREQDAHHGRGDDADQDRARAPLFGQPGRRQPDDHRIVAGQHQVDHDDLEEGGDRGLRENLRHAASIASAGRFDTRAATP